MSLRPGLNIAINVLITYWVLTLTLLPTTAHAMCAQDNTDIRSPAYLKELFNSSFVVGIFEIIKVAPKTPSRSATGEYTQRLWLKPIEIFKGKVKTEHVHEYGGIQHKRYLALQPDEFKLKEKYLFALGHPDGSGVTTNESCSHFMMLKPQNASEQIKLFRQLSKH